MRQYGDSVFPGLTAGGYGELAGDQAWQTVFNNRWGHLPGQAGQAVCSGIRQLDTVAQFSGWGESLIQAGGGDDAPEVSRSSFPEDMSELYTATLMSLW